MRSALAKDTLRTIRHSLRRFVSIAAICMLGTTMFVGLTIACEDLRLSADEYFDAQRLYDVSVQSTLGLTDDDVDALGALDGVSAAQGGWKETAYTEVDNASQSVAVSATAKDGMNEPHLIEGRLPAAAGEVAVTSDYLADSGKRIGDTLTFGVDGDPSTWAADDTLERQQAKAQDLLDNIEDADDVELTDDERDLLDQIDADDLARAAIANDMNLTRWADLTDDDLQTLLTDAYQGRFDDLSASDATSKELFARRTYTIVAEVGDPTNVAAKHGSSSFRATGARYAFFVSDADATTSAYSVVYLQVAGATELSGFTGAYQDKVDAVLSQAEGIKEQRERAREEQIAADGNAQIDEAEQSANDEFERAQSQIDEAQATIDDALAQIESGREQLAAKKAEATDALAAAQAQIDAGRAQLSDPATREGAIAQARAALEQNEQYQAAKDALAQLEQTRDGYAALEGAAEQLEAAIAQAEAAGADADTLGALHDQLDAVQTQMTGIEAALAAQGTTVEALPALIEQAQAGITAAEAAADAAVDEQLSQMSAQLDDAQAQLVEQRDLALAQLDEAAAQLSDAAAQAADGQAELDDARAEFERQKADALAKIADARAKLADVGSATWYVQDRSAISSYSSIDSDASSIEVIGTVFPAIFLTVAILMSITTATRMVEEERGLIGLYKALGYPRHRIMAKYAGYTIAATLVGCGVGALLGFVALPKFLFTVFAVMYTLPAFTLHFSAGLCALAFGLFVVGIGAATLVAVRGELAECPAALMRPKAPRAGKRILLEHIGPVWRRLSFLNKVTARNLFRYKSRLAMTVFGVAGCCALMIMGFGINDTVQALSPNQYGGAGRAGIYSYDLLAATQPADLEVAAQRLTDSSRVDSYVAVRYENVTVEHNGAKQTMQLVVVPNDFALDGYIDLRTQDGRHLDLAGATADGGALLTKNAAVVLGFGEGDSVRLQDTSLNQADVKVSGIVMNYLGNAVYLTQDSYERLFGQALEPNALLAKLNGTDDEKIAFADELGGDATFLSVTSVAAGIRDFESNFMLINYVVALVTALAAGLSFVVLFTLATTNISERERELATIKVLGFRKREVRVYINKELLILALIGTIVGIPLGCVLGHSLTYVLNMPSMYFAVEINPLSYVWSCGLSMLFALATSLVTSRSIDRVDMVGALKSAE